MILLKYYGQTLWSNAKQMIEYAQACHRLFVCVFVCVCVCVCARARARARACVFGAQGAEGAVLTDPGVWPALDDKVPSHVPSRLYASVTSLSRLHTRVTSLCTLSRLPLPRSPRNGRVPRARPVA